VRPAGGSSDNGRSPDQVRQRALPLIGAGLIASTVGLALWLLYQNGKRATEIQAARSDFATQLGAATKRADGLEKSATASAQELAEVRKLVAALGQRLQATEQQLQSARRREAQILAATRAQKTVKGLRGPVTQEPLMLECVTDTLEEFYTVYAVCGQARNFSRTKPPFFWVLPHSPFLPCPRGPLPPPTPPTPPTCPPFSVVISRYTLLYGDGLAVGERW
jgi:hypothetical protein